MSLFLNALVCGLTNNSVSIWAFRCLLSVGDNQHRAGGRIDNMLSDGADNEILEAVSAVGTHDDQVRSKFLSNLNDGVLWLAAVQQVIHFNIISV